MEELLDIMRRLRDPDSGCPWDVAQDFASIAPYTIEEAYEVADAIERKAYGELKDELGDLLLQIVFHSQMADEAGLFDFTQVSAGISEKLLRRHPHVFSGQALDSPEAVAEAWDAGKARERQAKGISSLMDGVPGNMPEMLRAKKFQKRAAEAGFDWPSPAPVLDKYREELVELEEAISNGRQQDIMDELGDLLFVGVNLARKLRVDPGRALRHANAKFERRFRAMEALAGGKEALSGMQLDDMEALWQLVKKQEHQNGTGSEDPGEETHE